MATTGKYALLAFQLIGLVASIFLASVTFLNSDQVEQRLQRFAVEKVEIAADAAWMNASAAVAGDGRAGRLGALAAQFGFEANALDAKREDIVPALLAYALSDRCGENCGLAALTGFAENTVLLEQAAALRVGQTTLGDFVVERYDETVRGLTLDLRRFAIVNVVVLALMIALILAKDMLNTRFVVFSVAVTGYATWATYGYIYQQNWARTILMQNWAADGYQAGMIFVCCLFFDWLFLSGYVTQSVGNAIAVIMPS